jgi:ribosomal protein S18 acetylase RimI-like enzyme
VPRRDPFVSRTLRPSRRRWSLLLAVFVAFTALGIATIVSGEAWGWLAAIFFGLGIPISVLVLTGRINTLHLTPEGFTIRSLRTSTIGWDDVEAFGTFETAGGTMVGFTFAPSYDRATIGRALARELTGSPYEGGLPDTYGMKAEELAALMEEWRSRHAMPE